MTTSRPGKQPERNNMDTLDLYISKNVTAAHVVKVPCSFSPSGVHYLSIMLGEKEQAQLRSYDTGWPRVPENHAHGSVWTPSHDAIPRFKLTENAFVLNMSCECADTVPKDVLEGMLSLVQLSKRDNKTSMCYAVLLQLQALFQHRTHEEAERLVKVADLPKALQPVAEYVHSQRFTRQLRDIIPKTPQEKLAERAGHRFTKIFNTAAGFTSRGFHIEYSSDLGFALMNNRRFGAVLARRLSGAWVLEDGWDRSEGLMRRLSEADLGAPGSHCYACDKVIERRHDTYSVTHTKNAYVKLKRGLLATRDFPVMHEVNKVPKNIGKVHGITVLSRDDYATLFAPKALVA